MQPEILLAEDGEAFVRTAVEAIAAEVKRAAMEHGRCRLALAGGGTPRPVYEALARGEWSPRIPWSVVEIYFSDERCVPPDDPESNYRMVRESLLDGTSIQPAHVHRIRAETPDAARAAAEYDRDFPHRLDLLLLGMGADGHTASLFPGSPALDELTLRVVPAQSPLPPRRRITITPRVISEARSILVLIRGRAKAEAVGHAVRGDYKPKDLPIQLTVGGRWILDRAAAAELLAEAP